MRRREFITFFGGAAAWPLSARAQQPGRMRQIGVLMAVPEHDMEYQTYMSAFREGLQKLGWIEGRNVRIDYRWGAGNADNIRKFAAELVALAPDVIVAGGTAALAPLLQATRTVPLLFVFVVDPVGAGFVDSLSRPGGNATGFVQFEYSLSGKWLELLKQLAPGVTRAAVLRDPTITAGVGQFAIIQSVAPSVGVEVSPVNVRDAGEIERAVAAFARSSNGGLIVTTSALAVLRRDLIIALAARHKLPAVYYRRYFATSGGLISYGADLVEQHRGAAAYVDRILKGEQPADLPVQAPTKYELIINLKTAKALGLDVPQTLLARSRRGDRVKRREFITLLGGAAAAWPLGARSQPGMPVIGYLSARSPEDTSHLVEAFRRGLNEVGFVEGRNVTVEYRWALGQANRLPELAADLVRKPVTVVVSSGGESAALAAKAATSTIPLAFIIGGDPVKLGLAVSYSRPGGNATGISILTATMEPKRLELVRELVPQASTIGVLLDPSFPPYESQLRDLRDATHALDLRVQELRASTDAEIDTAFEAIAQQHIRALLVGSGLFYDTRRDKLVALAARHTVPTMYHFREFAVAGGLMSYGIDARAVYRQIGVYAGGILKGEKPSELPILQPTKFELVINLKTAKALGLKVPLTLQVAADEVIE